MAPYSYRARWFRGARKWYAALFLVGCLSCKNGPVAAQTKSSRGEPVSYSFGTVDGQVETAEQHRGRVTVLLFVTTFDVFSQAGAKRLEDLYRSYSPRINALAVVLEAPQYAPLARSFRDVLKLSYPVALVEKQRLQENGILGAVQTVPAWVFLDASGRISFAGSGALSIEQLEQAVRAAESKR